MLGAFIGGHCIGTRANSATGQYCLCLTASSIYSMARAPSHFAHRIGFSKLIESQSIRRAAGPGCHARGKVG